MKKEFLEAGKIVNTHGIHGEVKILPWADSPDFLCRFGTLYLDGSPRKVSSAYVHKGNVIVRFDGIHDINDAIPLKNKIVSIARADAGLEPGQFFLADIIGLEVRDIDSGSVLGTIEEVLTPPANHVYVVKTPSGSFMIPAVPEFIRETNVDDGYVLVHLIEGMM